MQFRVIPMSSGEYDVQVERPTGVRTHRVHVGADLLQALDTTGSDGADIVTAALDVLDQSGELRDLPSYVDLAGYRARRGFVAQLRERIA
jgi:hypothetical protein